MAPRTRALHGCVAVGVGALTLLGTGVASAAPADGRTIFGVTSGGNRLVSFPANAPGAAKPVTTVNGGSISGLGAGEQVVGTDFRPADGLLYALTIGQISGAGDAQTGTGRIYTIDKTTAVATLVSTLSVSLTGAYFDIGFNPVANALRIVSSNGQNLRVTGAGLATTVSDTSLAYASGDVNSGKTARVAAADYTPAVSGATTLYDLDYRSDALATQGAVGGGTAGTAASPNSGVLSTVGTGLGVDVTNLLGFDIESDGTAYATAQTVSDDGGVSTGSTLFTVNTANGKLTSLGSVGGDLLDSIAIDPATPVAPPAALPEFNRAAAAPVAAVAVFLGLGAVRRRRSARA